MRCATTFTSAFLAGAVLAVSLSGCGAQPARTQAGTAAEPTFTGPFADEFTEAWRDTDSELVRTIIDDEVVTDQEWSQIVESLKTCLSDQGITITTYNDDGSYEADVGDKEGDSLNEIIGECEEESGEAWVGYIYLAQTTNPDNTPETELLTDCLIRNGAVPPTYTEKEYLEDAPEFEFPFLDDHGYEIFEKCNADPSVVL